MSDLSSEIDRENEIISDLLTLVKMDSTENQLNISSVNINDMINQLLKVLTPLAQQKNIDLVFESFRPIEADVDQVKLSMAINNLIENAIKYNKPGGSVRVSVYGTDENAYFLVSDTGIGIAEEHLPRLFERFYRVDKGRSRSMGGTGLGLAIVKHIAVSMGGTVEVHSKLGEGSEFSVTLPRYFGNETEEEETTD